MSQQVRLGDLLWGVRLGWELGLTSVTYRIGMHMLFYGKEQQRLMETSRMESILKEQSVRVSAFTPPFLYERFIRVYPLLHSKDNTMIVMIQSNTFHLSWPLTRSKSTSYWNLIFPSITISMNSSLGMLLSVE